MKYPILHGLEVELQLMVETENGLEIVDACNFLERRFDLLPYSTIFDLGNIEIRTNPCNSYKEAINNANFLLLDKLVPALIKDFKLKKFALFLPSPMSQFNYEQIPIFSRDSNEIKFLGFEFKTLKLPEAPSCLKHWNISFPFHTEKIIKTINSIASDIGDAQGLYLDLAKELINKEWKYNYDLLKSKGYPVLLKDYTLPYRSRVHIKIPYHYSPPEGNPDLMPKFEDTLIPPDKWRNLLSYYKNNNFVKIRDLI